MRLPALVELARPQQWYKNLVVFIALVFSHNAANLALWRPAAVTFAAFVLLSSAAYAWNDVVDAARDRDHPTKRTRPVARGAIPPGVATLVGAALAAAGLVALGAVNAPTLLIGGAFLALQALYNALLRHEVIWDVLVIGVGFVLRALAGTTAIDVGAPTPWLVLCTFLFALFLGLAKRRRELVQLDRGGDADAAVPHRATLRQYSLPLVEQMSNIVATLLLVSYFLYTFFGTSVWMMLTIPFAVYGVLRHLYLIQRRGHADESDLLFRDRATLFNAAAWLLTVLVVLEGWPQRLLAWLQTL